MKIFLSSSFRDLIRGRKIVLEALQRRQQSFAAMEFFLATAKTPLDTCLAELSNSDVVVVVVGLRSGSLLPDGSMTYTLAEFEQARRDNRPILGFIKKGWRNDETSPDKVDALNRLKAGIESYVTPTTFTTAHDLALKVIQSLDAWESEGRPGARKTFVSPAEYFGKAAPQFASELLDYSTTLVGRADEILNLNAFLASGEKYVGVLSGRGGTGKSKLMHDWTKTVEGWEVVVLRYPPVWHVDSDKEIPAKPTVIVVDDAHRPELERDIAQVVEVFRTRRGRQRLKLVFLMRPRAMSRFLVGLRQKIDESQVKEFPEIADLTESQAEELASEVLGSGHSFHAKSLAQIAGRSPLVIVAGGRLIAEGKVDLSRLSGNAEFKRAVFDRFIDELHLEGPDFALDPPRPLIELIAALGPVDVRNEQFLQGTEVFLRAERDIVLKTIDALASRGIFSGDSGAVRILPDVLSDFILEESCVNRSGESTLYADRLYAVFGSFLFAQLMQNLAELDWRFGRDGSALGFLDEIWQQIEGSFLTSEAHQRHKILKELSPAAFFQPERVLSLIEKARSNPVPDAEPQFRHFLKDQQKYVLSAAPRLLEATAHNMPHLQRSVDALWELSREEDFSENHDRTARNTLKRLASYQLNGWAAFNFAMLLQCVRLTKRRDAFERGFTPIDIIDEILEREGEVDEFDGNVFRFGGFALNYSAVELLRKNAINFLEYLLAESDDRVAVRAIHSLDSLLHNYLNRIGHESTQEELDWQNAERLECLAVLQRRLLRSGVSLPVRSEIHDAIRSATGFNYTEPVRLECDRLWRQLQREPDLAIFDALTRREGDLPLKDRNDPAGSSTHQYAELIGEARAALDVLEPGARADKLAEFVKTAHEAGLETRGFGAILNSFSQDPGFIAILLDRLTKGEVESRFLQEISSVFGVLRLSNPQEYRRRARTARQIGPANLAVAASSALRVFNESATNDDALLISEFARSEIPAVKRYVLYAIAYMGSNEIILPTLLDAALSVDIGRDPALADDLAEAFGPYGVPLKLLNDENARLLLAKFLPLEDLDAHQGAVPRFLSRMVGYFPEQVVGLLTERISIEEQRRAERDWTFRALGVSHHAVSFGGMPTEVIPELLRRALECYLRSARSAETAAELFWSIDPTWKCSFTVLAEKLGGASEAEVTSVDDLLLRCPRTDALAYEALARVVEDLSPDDRRRVVAEGMVARARASKGHLVGGE